MSEIMLKSQRPYSPGLEGIVAGLSVISEIDPKSEHLTFRGFDIHDLVEHSTYEETAYLLLMGRLPKKTELEGFTKSLSSSFDVPAEVLNCLKSLPKNAHPMDALRSGVSLLSAFDPDVKDNSHDSNIRKAVRLIAKFPTLIAAYHRFSKGLDAIKPNPTYSHAKNFLYMMTGKEPDSFMARVFDQTLVIYAEHGFNASTFSARVTASTHSDLHCAITSGIGTLKGALHGGANEHAMKMLLEIGEVSRAKAWIEEALATKKRIMGFGHREYKSGDPRAKILKPVASELGKRLGVTKWAEISEIVEGVMIREKGLFPNVDFPSAAVYYLMGLPTEIYTPIFALARIAGWSAHVIEQLDNNRLIRPECEYTGQRDQSYILLDKR